MKDLIALHELLITLGYDVSELTVDEGIEIMVDLKGKIGELGIKKVNN